MPETKPEGIEEGDLISKDQLPSERELDQQIKEQHTKPSGEEHSKEEEIVQEETEQLPPKQPAPVPGETDRERGLRKEVEKLKAKLRQPLIAPEIKEKPKADPYKELREKGYSDDDIEQMEVAVDLIAKNKGYVRAEDNYKQSLQDTVDVFIEEHPEYKIGNDVDDIKWNMFQEVLRSGIYNLSGKTTKQLKSIFSKVDEDVKRELGEPIIVTSKEKLAAQRHKIQVASHSGGTKTTQKGEKKIDLSKPVGGVMFKGFDESDFE